MSVEGEILFTPSRGKLAFSLYIHPTSFSTFKWRLLRCLYSACRRRGNALGPKALSMVWPYPSRWSLVSKTSPPATFTKPGQVALPVYHVTRCFPPGEELSRTGGNNLRVKPANRHGNKDLNTPGWSTSLGRCLEEFFTPWSGVYSRSWTGLKAKSFCQWRMVRGGFVRKW